MIRNMKKYGWMAAGLLLTVVGCQRREMMYLGADVAPIHFSVAYQDAGVTADDPSSQALQTKVLVDLPKDSTVRVLVFQRRSGSPTPTADPRQDEFKVECTYKADGNGGLVPCAVNADGTVDPAGTAPEGISLNHGVYDFYAISPAFPVVQGAVGTNPYVVMGITHGIDLLNASVKAKTISKATSTVALEFEHKCAKVTFNVKQPKGANVAKLAVDSVVIHNMNPLSSVASGWWIYTDLTLGVGGMNDSVVFKTFGPLMDETASPAELVGRTGFNYLLPKRPKVVPAEIYLTLGDSAFLFKTTLPMVAYDKGKHYAYNLNFKKTVIEFTLDVLAWDKVSISGSLGADNIGDVLVGSWYYYVHDVDNLGTGGDNLSTDLGGWWQPVDAGWQLGTGSGLGNPNGDLSGWGDSGINNNPNLGTGTGTIPNGNTGSWGNSGTNNNPNLGTGTGTTPNGGTGSWGDGGGTNSNPDLGTGTGSGSTGGTSSWDGTVTNNPTMGK